MGLGASRGLNNEGSKLRQKTRASEARMELGWRSGTCEMETRMQISWKDCKSPSIVFTKPCTAFHHSLALISETHCQIYVPQ